MTPVINTITLYHAHDKIFNKKLGCIIMNTYWWVGRDEIVPYDTYVDEGYNSTN